MVKLYKQINGKLHYWETWEKNAKTGIIHWGIVGDKGESEEIKSGFLKSFKSKIQEKINQILAEGYKETKVMYSLLIEYAITGMGTNEDLDKRHRLEAKMNNMLGWTGLGDCDGGSIGSGTMEVCCFVVDFDIAKNAIEESLKNTEFANYTRIFDENSK